MNKKDEEEFTGLITEALNDVMIPALESMEERLTEKLASKEALKELSMKVDSLDRKFDAQQERLDRHSKVQENIEKRVSGLEAKMIVPQTY